MTTCGRCGERNAPTARFCQACGSRLEGPATTTRRLVSVVFCDLVGSTELSSSLDPEAWQSIQAAYFDTMSRILTRYGGTVEKYIGDAVVGAFGIPELHEDDALRAVRAALEMSDAAANLGEGISVRTGVASGEVVAGAAADPRSLVSGEAMSLAARLQAGASPGEVWMDALTERLVRGRIASEPRGTRSLKGRPVPEAMYAATGLLDADRDPQVLRGRDREVQELRGALARVDAGGEPLLITVFGPAGMGKSLLADHVGREAGWTSATGHCLPYGDGMSFWAVSELVRELCGIEGSSSSEAALEGLRVSVEGAPEAELIALRVASLLGLVEEVVETHEGAWGVRRLVEHIARDRPLLLVLEDLQWADDQMLDLIEYLVAFGHGPLTVLCTARPDLFDTRPAWGSNGLTLRLGELGEDDVARVVSDVLGGGTPAPGLVGAVQSLAQGNPFFAREYASMMSEQGRIVRRGTLWDLASAPGDDSVPPTVQAVVAARIDALPPAESAALRVASVAGRHFWSGATAAMGVNGAVLGSLVRRSILQPSTSDLPGEDGFAFAHILIRDTAYAALPKRERADLHQVFAAWLENKVGDRVREYEEILGFHLERAVEAMREVRASSDETDAVAVRAATFLAAAGQRALARGDVAAAHNLLTRAVGLLPDAHGQRGRVLLDLAEAAMESGDLEAADGALTEAEASLDATSRIPIDLRRLELLSYRDYERWLVEAPDAVRPLVEASTEAGDLDTAARALRLAAEVEWDNHRTGATEKLLRQAASYAERAGAERLLNRVNGFLASATFWGPTHVDEALEVCDRIMASTSNRSLRSICLRNVAGLTAMKGDFDRARLLSDEARSIDEESGHALRVAHSTQYRGLIELMAGDPGAAEASLREGSEMLARIGETAFLATQDALRARALYEMGDLPAALAATKAGERGAHEASAIAEWGPTRAIVCAALGELDEAHRVAGELATVIREVDDPITAGFAWECLAGVYAIGGQPGRATGAAATAADLYRGKGITMWERRARESATRVSV